jgi:hypothetical protein
MGFSLKRRQFLQMTTASAAALYMGPGALLGADAGEALSLPLSPGARKSKVRVAKLYLGIPKALWPMPQLDLNAERERYEAEFKKRAAAFGDVDFPVSELVTSPPQAQDVAGRLKDVDGVLLIHLSMGVIPMVNALLAAKKPTVLFAAPYSGHEWTAFGDLERKPEGALLSCMLTSDFDQLAAAVRPFRAIHHLREAKILDVIAQDPSPEYVKAVKEKFGTEVKRVDKERVIKLYQAVNGKAADALTEQWIKGAEKVVEPSRDEILKSCRLALAFHQLLDEEEATAITVDCYGSMYRQLPAFPCFGFTYLNDMGWAGICESDLKSAMTFLLLQGLSGKPGFISDPTVDESTDSIILAHCLGSRKMDGPGGETCPYKIRCIMERQEGAVTQVRMRNNTRVTQAELIGTDTLLYFTGDIIDAPDTDRGCRTKINVKVDGDIRTLWRNWSNGLHRVTCYGDVKRDLERFCKFKAIKMVDEAKA